jgi:type II secretory pathway predicted ATPase ExeA
VWREHWGLANDPFAELGLPYVSLPSHDEAVARLVYAIETRQPRALLTGAAGLGKTTVLRQAIRQSAGPRRRFAAVSAPIDEMHLVSQLAERLGQRVGPELSHRGSWRALERALRAMSLEGFQVVLAVDAGEEPNSDEVGRALDRLAGLSGDEVIRLTVIQASRRSAQWSSSGGGDSAWTMAAELKRLTRSQVECYLAAKLAGAGCTEPLFTPRATTRLHALSGGVPRGIDHLAALCLIAGAVRGLEVVLPEVVDGVAQECSAQTSELELEA